MRFAVAWCALAGLVLGISGCKSDGGTAPAWTNPLAAILPGKPSHPERPSAAATPTPPRAGMASAGDERSMSGSRTGTPTNYDARAGYNTSTRSSAGTNPYGSNLGFGTPGTAPSSTTSDRPGSYMAPQASRYDPGPSYNEPPTAMASRSSAPNYSRRDYAPADSYGPYGDRGASAGRAGTWEGRSASATSDPLAQPGAADPFASSGRLGDPSAARTTDSEYTRPWDRSATGTSAPGGASSGLAPGTAPRAYGTGTPEYTPPNSWYQPGSLAPAPGGTGYNPGATGYAPGSTGYAPGTTGYNPGNTGYNPGDNGYRPGDNGYNPPNTPRYELPATRYDASGMGAGEYRPGSTSSYTPRRTLLPDGPAGTSDTAASGAGADSGVSPAGFTAPKVSW